MNLIVDRSFLHDRIADLERQLSEAALKVIDNDMPIAKLKMKIADLERDFETQKELLRQWMKRCRGYEAALETIAAPRPDSEVPLPGCEAEVNMWQAIARKRREIAKAALAECGGEREKPEQPKDPYAWKSWKTRMVGVDT